jgi:hypothetical protein
MNSEAAPIFVVYDDREFTSAEVRPFVGSRRYSEIIYRRRKLKDYFWSYFSTFENNHLFHLRNRHDVARLRKNIEEVDGRSALFIVSSKAGIAADEDFKQLLARLPYAEDSFCDRAFKPMISFFNNSHQLIEHWDHFNSQPIHTWEEPQTSMERLKSVLPMDLGKSRDFLSFMSGSTETRHFNQLEVDTYYYTKKSSDKRKMEAEYRFYDNVPEAMRPWLIQPFDFKQDDTSASYKMMRYYLADSALQWVHGAFSSASFEAFIDRLLFFIAQRPQKVTKKILVDNASRALFLNKVDSRVEQFLELSEGQKVNQLSAIANPEMEISLLVTRYKKLYQKFEKEFHLDYLAAGHGDPCFSNLLYDQQGYTLKLIDPKGAFTEDDVWTHPYYDLCKISHSILGNYDFINNGLYEVSLNAENGLNLIINADQHEALKTIFLTKLEQQGYDWRVIRLGEASLFLSMLPLHVDHPNKVMAFVLIAKQILDELENV